MLLRSRVLPLGHLTITDTLIMWTVAYEFPLSQTCVAKEKNSCFQGCLQKWKLIVHNCSKCQILVCLGIMIHPFCVSYQPAINTTRYRLNTVSIPLLFRALPKQTEGNCPKDALLHSLAPKLYNTFGTLLILWCLCV